MAGARNGRGRYARTGSRAHSIRREGTRDQRRLVIIACEGQKTEPAYFRAIFDILKQERKLAAESCVIAGHNLTDPVGVLKDLRTFKTHMGFTYKDYDYRWIVIDRDSERTNGGGHSAENFNSALQQASSKRLGVDVAWSNPCFEIWFLLHFEYRNTPLERDELNRKLSKALGTTYDKSDKNMYDKLKYQTEVATRNATNLLEQALDRGVLPADSNPGTTVHNLVALLFSLRKK
jgi:hypothetical protein